MDMQCHAFERYVVAPQKRAAGRLVARNQRLLVLIVASQPVPTQASPTPRRCAPPGWSTEDGTTYQHRPRQQRGLAPEMRR